MSNEDRSEISAELTERAARVHRASLERRYPDHVWLRVRPDDPRLSSAAGDDERERSDSDE